MGAEMGAGGCCGVLGRHASGWIEDEEGFVIPRCEVGLVVVGVQNQMVGFAQLNTFRSFGGGPVVEDIRCPRVSSCMLCIRVMCYPDVVVQT